MRFENGNSLYKNLAQNYIFKDEENFNAVIAKNFNEFEADRNWGLV